MIITRPRKARLLEGAGLRYVGAWLPADLAESLAPAIKAAEAVVADTLARVGETPGGRDEIQPE